MRHIEAPPFTQRDMNGMLLSLFEKLGTIREDMPLTSGSVLSILAATACEAITIGNHQEVGAQYLRERIYTTVRDGLQDETTANAEQRPCELFVGEKGPEPQGEGYDAEHRRRKWAYEKPPIFIRCTNYRPFSTQHSQDWDRKYRRSEKTYPMLLTRIEDLDHSKSGLFWCKVIGPKPYAYEESYEEQQDHATHSERWDYQASLDFHFSNAYIIIPRRDVDISPAIAADLEHLDQTLALNG